MAERLGDPPFARGCTAGATAVTDLTHLEGKEYWFENLDYSTSPAKARPSGGQGEYVKCRIVRNTGAVALLPKDLVKFATANYGKYVDGKTCLTAGEGYPIDEFLPAAGCPVNDLCWIVIDGDAMCRTDLAGADNNVITQGGWLVALTGATSGATTAGRVYAQDLSGATALLANQVQNRIGIAMSSKTTGQTNGDVLVKIKRW